MKYESKEAFEKANIFGTGTANTAHAQYFIGNSFLNPIGDQLGLFLTLSGNLSGARQAHGLGNRLV